MVCAKCSRVKQGFCCFCRTLGISSGLDEVVGCLLGIHGIMKIKKSVADYTSHCREPFCWHQHA